MGRPMYSITVGTMSMCEEGARTTFPFSPPRMIMGILAISLYMAAFFICTRWLPSMSPWSDVNITIASGNSRSIISITRPT